MTVGQCAVDLLAKGDQKQSVIDTTKEMQRGYVDELIKCAKRYDWPEPFFICVQTRRERLLTNVIRCQFYARLSRPTPQYDLALYSYDPKKEQLRFEWVVPDKQTVEDVVTAHNSAINLPLDPDLKRFCVEFHKKTLM
jgi:hypothetical protein